MIDWWLTDDWCWLMMIDADWCWLMLIDADWWFWEMPESDQVGVHPRPLEHCPFLYSRSLNSVSNLKFQTSGGCIGPSRGEALSNSEHCHLHSCSRCFTRGQPYQKEQHLHLDLSVVFCRRRPGGIGRDYIVKLDISIFEINIYFTGSIQR